MNAKHVEQLVFTNDFKIRFCNGYSAIRHHARGCGDCEEYLRNGEGDLCQPGKEIIMKAMVLQDEKECL